MARRAEIQEDNRRALRAAAVELIAGKGFSAATVQEIAALAGLTTGAVYSAFGGKRELFCAAIALCRDHLDLDEALRAAPEVPAADLLRRFGHAFGTAAAAPPARRLFLFELELTAL